MSKLNIDQKSVRALFSEKKADFLIPDYQRPYAWGEKECQTLWDDLFLFAFPDNDCDKFNSDSAGGGGVRRGAVAERAAPCIIRCSRAADCTAVLYSIAQPGGFFAGKEKFCS